MHRYKAQVKAGCCMWSPKAYKTYINPQFASLAFCPYTCIPVIVPVTTAGCSATSEGICLQGTAQAWVCFLHWDCKNTDHLLAAHNLGTTMSKMAAGTPSWGFPACTLVSWMLYISPAAPSEGPYGFTTSGSKRQTMKLREVITGPETWHSKEIPNCLCTHKVMLFCFQNQNLILPPTRPDEAWRQKTLRQH